MKNNKKRLLKILFFPISLMFCLSLFIVNSFAQETSYYYITNENVSKTIERFSLNVDDISFDYNITNNDNYLLIDITNLSTNLFLNNKVLNFYYYTNSNYSYTNNYDYANLKFNYDLYFYYIDNNGIEQAFQPYDYMSITFGDNFEQSENYYKDYEANPYSTAEEGSNINYQFLHYSDSGEPDFDFNFYTFPSGDYSRYLNLKIYIFEINILSDSMIYGNYDLSANYNDGYNSGYGVGYNSGYANGYDTGFSNGNKSGLVNGYDSGYQAGLNVGVNSTLETQGIRTLFNSILSFPVDMIKSVFNFEFMGVNIASVITFIISIGIVAFVLKKFL